MISLIVVTLILVLAAVTAVVLRKGGRPADASSPTVAHAAPPVPRPAEASAAEVVLPVVAPAPAPAPAVETVGIVTAVPGPPLPRRTPGAQGMSGSPLEPDGTGDWFTRRVGSDRA